MWTVGASGGRPRVHQVQYLASRRIKPLLELVGCRFMVAQLFVCQIREVSSRLPFVTA